MIIRMSICFMAFLLMFPANGQGFRQEQMKHGRVNKAYEEKSSLVQALLQVNELDSGSLHIFIRAFKKEHELEVWGRDSLREEYVLLKEYHICRVSGKAGPKRKQGDKQIPEGCYHIDRFNPWSNFHLSLGINYPNASDRILSDKRHPGGQIFIHGSCVTIGCIPMTDDRMKELYILAVEARNNGQEHIPVHVFPCRMEGEAYAKMIEDHADDEQLISFWNNIEEAYLYFEQNGFLPEYTVDEKGRYCFR
jgi:murein L,D-transpeptidase YafK